MRIPSHTAKKISTINVNRKVKQRESLQKSSVMFKVKGKAKVEFQYFEFKFQIFQL